VSGQTLTSEGNDLLLGLFPSFTQVEPLTLDPEGCPEGRSGSMLCDCGKVSSKPLLRLCLFGRESTDPFTPFPAKELAFSKKDGRLLENFTDPGPLGNDCVDKALGDDDRMAVVPNPLFCPMPGVDSLQLLSETDLLLLLTGPVWLTPTLIAGVAKLGALLGLCRTPGEIFVTAAGDKYFTFPASGPDLNEFSLVSDGRGLIKRSAAPAEHSTASFLEGDGIESPAGLLLGVKRGRILQGDLEIGFPGLLWFRRLDSRDRELPCIGGGLWRLFKDDERERDEANDGNRSSCFNPSVFCFSIQASQDQSSGTSPI